MNRFTSFVFLLGILTGILIALIWYPSESHAQKILAGGIQLFELPNGDRCYVLGVHLSCIR
jgi:hypothetical protein